MESGKERIEWEQIRNRRPAIAGAESHRGLPFVISRL
jgi:hypothetical protein